METYVAKFAKGFRVSLGSGTQDEPALEVIIVVTAYVAVDLANDHQGGAKWTQHTVSSSTTRCTVTLPPSARELSFVPGPISEVPSDLKNRGLCLIILWSGLGTDLTKNGVKPRDRSE